MAILWITSMYLLRIFNCKYNTEIMVPFFSDELLCLNWSHHFNSSAQLQAPTFPAFSKAEQESS